MAEIARHDAHLGAFLSVSYPDAPGVKGPLHGIPYAAKDNLCTATLPTTCASRMLEDYHPPYDATVIARMQEAGAILVGKTNMDEFAMGSSNETSAFHPVANPWRPDHVPGGSSGGSAAAVAAGLVPLALGTDTGGSIRQPAAFCGITGMKPTYGAVSRMGLVAFASSMDQVGPMAMTASDCAAAMDILVAHDPGDSTSSDHPDAGDFLRRVRAAPDGCDGLRIGIPREYFGQGVDPEVVRAVRSAADVFSELGARVEEMSLPHTVYALPTYYILASAEAASNLARFDGVRYGRRAAANSIEELYWKSRGEGFGREVQRRITLGTFVLSAGYYDAYYLKAARVRGIMAGEITRAFAQYDYLLTPTCPTTAFPRDVRTEDPLAMYMADVCTIPANLAGIPAVSVPGGLVNGLPVGVQLMGRRFDDAGVLALADRFQRATGHHLLGPEGFGDHRERGGEDA